MLCGGKSLKIIQKWIRYICPRNTLKSCVVMYYLLFDAMTVIMVDIKRQITLFTLDQRTETINTPDLNDHRFYYNILISLVHHKNRYTLFFCCTFQFKFLFSHIGSAIIFGKLCFQVLDDDDDFTKPENNIIINIQYKCQFCGLHNHHPSVTSYTYDPLHWSTTSDYCRSRSSSGKNNNTNIVQKIDHVMMSFGYFCAPQCHIGYTTMQNAYRYASYYCSNVCILRQEEILVKIK